MDSEEARLANREKMRQGELYYAFTPDLIAARSRCTKACRRFNHAEDVPRRHLVELWRDLVQDKTPLPPLKDDPEEDEALFENEPWIEAPIRMDYGFNVKAGEGVFINANCHIIDTCLVTVGHGPCPESGKEIHIGEDCWLAGNVTVLPGVTIGKGATIGAGSVVTKDVPAFHLALGNPARVVRKIETAMEGESSS
ncbi:acetyltransferase [Aspergillus flavus]|nr:acetyltransferase [Aspergillus flavus]